MAESQKMYRSTAREKSRRDKRMRGRALLIFYISAFSAVVIGAILLCIFVFFRVNTVEIIGGDCYRQEDILSICDINQGDNLVLLDTDRRKAEIEHRFPYIENVEIQKKIPSTVNIVITEATAQYSVESKSGYLYLSHSGKILEISDKPYPGSVVVSGGTPASVGLSKLISFEEESAQTVFSEINRQLQEKDVKNISSIDMRNQYDIQMTYDERIVFQFGNVTDMQYKMSFGLEMLNQMLNSGEITEETRGEIDLTVVPDKNKAFFRETPLDKTSNDTGTDVGEAGNTDDTGDTGYTGDTGDTDNTGDTGDADDTDDTGDMGGTDDTGE